MESLYYQEGTVFMSLSTKVVIFEPQVLMRQGLAKLLDSRLFNVVAETSYMDDVSELVDKHLPDIVIFGQKSLQSQTLEVAEELIAKLLNVYVVILSETGTYTEVLQANDIGVHGYLLKSFDAFSFNRALNIILTGEQVFPLDLDKGGRARDKIAVLTNRERQILWHIANGSSNKKVGRDLDITEGTVKVHVKSILKKLDIDNRTQAAIYVHEQGVSECL